MTDQKEEILEAISVGRSGRRQWRCPLPLRKKIVEYSQSRREGGASIEVIAGDLGLSESGLRRWLNDSPDSGGFRTVRVEDRSPDDGGLSLVTPGGYRLEGLTAGSAADILRRLGC